MCIFTLFFCIFIRSTHKMTFSTGQTFYYIKLQHWLSVLMYSLTTAASPCFLEFSLPLVWYLAGPMQCEIRWLIWPVRDASCLHSEKLICYFAVCSRLLSCWMMKCRPMSFEHLECCCFYLHSSCCANSSHTSPNHVRAVTMFDRWRRYASGYKLLLFYLTLFLPSFWWRLTCLISSYIFFFLHLYWFLFVCCYKLQSESSLFKACQGFLSCGKSSEVMVMKFWHGNILTCCAVIKGFFFRAFLSFCSFLLLIFLR